MVMVNTQRPALEEVIPQNPRSVFLQNARSFQLMSDNGEVLPLYLWGVSKPWHGPYCERQIPIAVFGLTPSADDKALPDVFCCPVLLRPPTAQERAKDGKTNQGMVVVEGLEPGPAWPAFQLHGRAGRECRGCEREAGRTESYRVNLLDPAGRLHACAFGDEGRWRAFAPAARWKAKIRVVTGGLPCGSLESAP